MGIYECRILLLGVIFLFSEGLGCIPGPDSVYLSVPEASCTFQDKTTCSYHAMPDWQPTEGESFDNHSSTPQVLLTAGQDDDFYMLFRSLNNTNASFTIASPTLPGGKYQITFWYASPVQKGLLELETVTTHSTNKHWNSNNTVQTSWTGENVIVEEPNNFTIAFNAYDDISVFFGLDNIEVCRASGPLTLQNGTVKYNDSTAELSCDHGYRLIGNTTLTWKSDSTTPVCLPVDITDVVYQNSTGGCSFAMNDSCAYTLDERWTIQGRTYLLNSRLLLQGGQDDDFYALFDSTKPIGDTGNRTYSMSSLLFQEGAACLSFYYTIPAAMSTLHVRTRVEDNSTSEMWNVTGRAIKTWTKVEGLVIWQMNKYFVDFAAKTSSNAIIGIDNIHFESLHCASGYNLNRSEVDGYCNKSRTRFPSCETVDCGDFIAPKKGTVSTIATTYGSTATVKCQAGYILNGSRTSQCGSDGRWSIVEQTCDPVDCGHFAAPQNGNVSTLATTYGSTATVKCRGGYVLNGSRTSLCEKDGSWTLLGQTCDPVDCGSFPALHNGSVTATHTILGSIATITCDTGFILSGSSTSTCDINGNWSSQNQSCTPVDCKPFSAPQNGYVLTTATTYGSNANVTCNTGYFLNGSSTSICGENGLWNTIDQTCEPVDCGDFAAPQNGTVATIANTYGSKATVTCQAGYILNGSRTSQCRSDGRWDIVGQACDPVDCGSFPALHNGSVTTTNTILGSIAQITCDTGYILNGSSTSMCDVNGFWSSQNQSCNLVDCNQLPIPSHGMISPVAPATTFGTALTITCNTGYNLTGNSTSTCDSNGNWSSIDHICDLVQCGNLSAPENGIINSSSTTYGSKAIVACHLGYNLIGTNTATCNSNGEWSHIGQICTAVDCGQFPDLLNGTIDAENTTFGSIVSLMCDEGFDLIGSSYSVCTITEDWNTTGQACQPLDCGPLPILINGSVHATNTTFGSIAVFMCDVGFNLTGNSQTVCGSTGQWNVTDQTCDIIDCGPLPTLSHGTVHTENSTFGSVAVLQCVEGFNLTGSSVSMCTSSGVWNSTGQKCSPLECGRVPELINGTIYAENTTFESVALLTCDKGFILTGSNRSMCTSSGLWNMTGQMCDPIDCGLLPALNNGSINYIENTTFDSIAVLTCDAGFNLTGDTLTVCNSSGAWNTTGQTCNLIDCGPLPILTNGTAHATNTTFGSVAIFTCDEGFNLTGYSHTVCGSNGIWNTIDQTCNIIDCGNLPALNNGSIMHIENTTFDSIAVLTCDAGFNLTGERYSVCNGSGVWNTTGQTCNPIDCGPLLPLLNGSVSADSTTFGSVALFTCDEGFTLFGSNLSVCSNNRNWNYTGQTCQRIDCGELPTLLNGTIAYTNNTTHGSIAILTCEGGFDLIGNTTSVCTTRGIWDSTDQSCRLKDCRAFPSLWNGFVTHSRNTTFGSRVFLKCDEGFYLSGSIYSECNSSGFWSYTDQTCNLIDCGPIPTLNHGTVHTENTTFESTAVFTCDKGFNLTGEVYSVCTGAGIWNSTHQTCNPIDCGPFPEIANGTISYSNNTTFGSVADVKCDEGFYLTGKINSECIGDGTWNSSGQKCKHIDCGPYPDLINGTVYTNNTLFGSIAVLKCDKGFNLTGHNYSECTTSGMWNSTAQICDPIDCGPFLELINGTAATNDTKLGSVAVLMCNEGFNLTGSEYSECISNGTWKLTGQHCNPIDCGSFPELINGTVTTDSTKFGSIAVLTCDDGFNLSGNNFSTCTSSGTWNVTTQICKQIDCGPFPVPSNGSVYTQSTTFGSVAYMTCKDGFILSGDRMSACNSSGNWNITGQTCEPIDCGPLASPGDGYLIGLETTYGHVFRVYCNTGYHLNGNDISSCGSDGNWTNTNFSCTLIDCGEVNPPINGTISRGATTYGSVVTITCNSGNKLIGNNTSLCQHTGIWSHENFTCKYVDCGPLHTPLGSYVTPLDTSYGTLASIKCNIGYQLFGNDTSFCDTDGNWTSTNFTCNIIDCGRPPEIKNGRMNFSATVFQSNANVMCDTGYVLSRSNTFLICLSNGSWSFYEFQCNPVDCGDLTTRGHQQITYAGNKTTFGTQAIMVCDIGYRLTNRPGVQSEAAVCNASGHWSIPHFSTCESIVCPSLNISWDEMDKNATTKGPYTANMAIQFTCKAGFTVNGFDNIICLSNGKWSGETPKCKKENKVYPNCTKKESWDETSPGGIRTQTCPGNSIGVVSRTCSPKGEWMQPVDGCVRKEIETISLQIEAIKYNPTQESITDSLNQLSNVTNISQNEQGENKVNTISVTSGELEKVTNILDTIVNASANINITYVTNNQVQKFLQTTSNILDASNTDSWKSIEQNNNNQDKSAVKVLQVVDRYIGVISKYINSSQNGSITVNTTNLVMHVSRIEKHTPYIQFPEENPGDFKTVYLPKSSLENASSFSAVVYKNLSGILSSNTVDNTSDAKSVISSEVISVNLDNWQSNPNFNISLTLAYFQTNSGQPKCTFWNMSRSAWDTNGCTLAIQGSNSSMCVCNHLTNFAILMSPWTENVDTTALDVISIVGCSISMLGLIITVVVHFHLWRYVRSDRVVILMNLSIALISSYAVFIGGVDRTENKALCTAMAVLLQYIYLVVFFLMLAEGIEIGITVLYVFVTKSRLKWILPAAWALPAVIVGVSMGATKLEGFGNTKFCWLSMEGGLIWAFVAPAMLIILVNFVVLILVIRTMFRSKTLSEKSRSERSKAGVRCMCVLLPLMGCTWVMGLLYVNESMAWVQYVFAVCNSLQGLVIFVFHCVLNVQIRNALLRRKHRKQSKSFISTNSASFVSTRVTEEPVALPKINLSTAKRTARGSLHSADDATGDVLQASGRTEINNVDTLF